MRAVGTVRAAVPARGNTREATTRALPLESLKREGSVRATVLAGATGIWRALEGSREL